MNKIKNEYKIWLKSEIYPKLGLGFHPDENFEDYINLKTKEETFTKKEASELNSKMEYFFNELGDAVYDIGFEELKKFHPNLGIGSDVNETKNIMSFSQFVNEQLIVENFEVVYTEHNCRGSKKFKNQQDALKFTKDFIKNNKKLDLSEIALYYGPVTNTSDTSKVIAWWDKGTNYFSNLSKNDSNLASKKIQHINESKQKSIYLLNTNIELKEYKYDINGNPIISCSFINKSNFQIQTGQGTGLVKTEYILSRQKFNELSDKDLIIIEQEIVDYIEKFGSKLQKQNLRKDSSITENYNNFLTNTNEFKDCLNAIIDEDYSKEDRFNDIKKLLNKYGKLEYLYTKYKTKNITIIINKIIDDYSKNNIELSDKAKKILQKIEKIFGKYFLTQTDDVEICIDFKNNIFSKSDYKLIEFYYDLEHDAFNLRIETQTSLLPEYAIENSLSVEEIINTIELIRTNKY